MGVLFFFYFGKCGELNFYPDMTKILEYFFVFSIKSMNMKHEPARGRHNWQAVVSLQQVFFFRELIKRCISTDLLSLASVSSILYSFAIRKETLQQHA